MNTKSVFLSGLRTVIMVGLVSLAGSFTSLANAADGCGCGYHKSIYGGCIQNYRGSYFRNAWVAPTPVYLSGCWRNGLGQLRCSYGSGYGGYGYYYY